MPNDFTLNLERYHRYWRLARCTKHRPLSQLANQGFIYLFIFLNTQWLYFEFRKISSLLTVSGMYKTSSNVAAVLTPTTSSLMSFPRSTWARTSHAKHQRGRGVRQPSWDTWRCFVHLSGRPISEQNLSGVLASWEPSLDTRSVWWSVMSFFQPLGG